MKFSGREVYKENIFDLSEKELSIFRSKTNNGVNSIFEYDGRNLTAIKSSNDYTVLYSMKMKDSCKKILKHHRYKWKQYD